jgi:hypothetical protein
MTRFLWFRGHPRGGMLSYAILAHSIGYARQRIGDLRFVLRLLLQIRGNGVVSLNQIHGCLRVGA